MNHEEKTCTCVGCGKMKKEGEQISKDGKTYCCANCPDKKDEKTDKPLVCEFC